jgi:uncharacterized protein YybS (DUF2232 family)
MLHMLVSCTFALTLLARLVKTCLSIILNHLELFSMIFGATFVFKISPNFAFKNILENGVLIEKWTLNH